VLVLLDPQLELLALPLQLQLVEDML